MEYDPTTAASNADVLCDESKCISKGKSEFGSFTCYGEDNDNVTFHPITCADGFLPRVVEDEAPVLWTDVNERGDDVLITLRYFTCCPPGHQIDTTARHCSDPIVPALTGLQVDDDGNDDENFASAAICDGTREFPRKMKPRGSYKFYDKLESVTNSFICCDSKLPVGNSSSSSGENNRENNTVTPTHFLDDLECVQYCDEFYKECKVENLIGKIQEISCNVPEGDFRFPHSVLEGTYNNFSSDRASTRWYQCCKTGPALAPFVQDSSFKIVVFSNLIFYSIGAIASAIVVVGLLIPLLIQLKKGIYQRPQSRRSRSRSRSTSRRNTSLHSSGRISLHSSGLSSVRSSSVRTLQNDSLRMGGQEEEPRYSTYNLYLVYLAIPDLVYCLFRIGRCVRMVNQKVRASKSLFWAVSVSSLVANLWINAIICFQVVVLLRHSKRGEKVVPPSLTKVNAQSFAVLMLFAISFFVVYFLFEEMGKASTIGDAKKHQTLYLIYNGYFFLMCLPPFGFVLGANIVVLCRGYISFRNRVTSSNGRALRALAFYFLRVVGVYFGVWIPVIVLTIYSDVSGTAWTYLLAGLLTACQPIVTTCAILTKPDARKYILDLVTLSYLYGICKGGDIQQHSNNQTLAAAIAAAPVTPRNSQTATEALDFKAQFGQANESAAVNMAGLNDSVISIGDVGEILFLSDEEKDDDEDDDEDDDYYQKGQ